MVKLLLEFILLMWLIINYINAENCQGHDRIKFSCPDGQDKTKERCCFSVVPGERYVGLYCCSMQEYESINLDNDCNYSYKENNCELLVTDLFKYNYQTKV